MQCEVDTYIDTHAQLQLYCQRQGYLLRCDESGHAERVYKTQMCTNPAPCLHTNCCSFAHSSLELRDGTKAVYHYELEVERPGLPLLQLKLDQAHNSLADAKRCLASQCIEALGDTFVPVSGPRPAIGAGPPTIGAWPPESLTQAIFQVLSVAELPMMASRLAELLYERQHGSTHHEEVKVAGGISKVIVEIQGVRLLYDYPPGFTPPVSSVTLVVDAEQRNEHVSYLTNSSSGRSWTLAGKSTLWAASGAPLSEVLAAIPPIAKGIKMSDLRVILQQVLQCERTVKHLRLLVYLQGYPDLFTLRTSPDGIVYNVAHAKHVHTKQGPRKQQLIKVIQKLIAQEPASQEYTFERLVGSVGGKFGTNYPDLNAFVKSQYGGVSVFMSLNARTLLDRRHDVPPSTVTTPKAALPSVDDPLIDQAVDVLRKLALQAACRAQSDVPSLHQWAGSLGGMFGSVHRELNAHVKRVYGGFGTFFMLHAEQILPPGSSYAGSSTCRGGDENADAAVAEFVDTADLPQAVEWLTSNTKNTQVVDWLGVPSAWVVLPSILEVVSSYGSEGVDVGPELKLQVGRALQCNRTVKLLRLDSYLRAFIEHFYVEDTDERQAEDGSTVRCRVYTSHFRPSTQAVPGKNKMWEQLTAEEVEAANALGYQQTSWERGLAPTACTFPWHQLSTAEHVAATVAWSYCRLLECQTHCS